MKEETSSVMIPDGSGSESQESTSTATVENTLDISFEDLVYSVRNGILSGGRKQILNGASGSFRAGDLSVIVGQSGAGKSSLMDILAGLTKQTEGRLLVNGRVRDDHWFRRRSCYIMQDDQLQEVLTVEESLKVAAELKLGKHIHSIQKDRRVEEIIVALGLDFARNTRSSALSGGQKKRLAIGLELVSDPPVIFLDEPTSGLDISTSKQLVYLLQQLARQGRTLVITMHQPSTPILSMMDRLYAVVNGRCAFIGSVPHLVPYLKTMDLQCPPYHNPVDFLMEICSGAFGPDVANRLVDSCRNGKSTSWAGPPAPCRLESIIEKSLVFDDLPFTALPSCKETDTNRILLKLKSNYATSLWTQFSVLTCRALKTIWRNPSSTILIIGIHCTIALLLSFLYYNIGEDAKYARDNYNFLYFSLMFLMFTAFSMVSVNFPTELPVVRREHFNRWYSTLAYFCSTLVAALPVQMFCTFCYAIITYWLTCQPLDWKRFIGFSAILILVSYVALCIGLLNGAIFTVKNGVVFGPFFIMPFTIFSGFFLRYSDAPQFLRWIFHISFLKHGLVGLVLSIFGMNREKLPCSADYCHYSYPKTMLEDNGMVDEDYSMVVAALIVIASIVLSSAYLMLRIRLKRKW